MGVRARLIRLAREWTQDQVAAKAGVTANTIRAFERGHNLTRDENVDQICRALGTSREALQQSGDIVKIGDPLLKHLNREDLLIAQQYHDSTTAVRARVARLLNASREESASAIENTDAELEFAAVWARMSTVERQIAAQMFGMFRQRQAEDAASAATAPAQRRRAKKPRARSA